MDLVHDAPVGIDRPQRWDVQFGPDMTEADVDRLMETEPFASMDESKFPKATPLRGILLNDTRLVSCDNGDLIIRENDYGGSAFLILDGAVRVSLESLPPRMLGRRERQRKGLWSALSQLWTNPTQPEVRKQARARFDDSLGTREERGQATRIFLQDVPGVLDEYNTARMVAGEIFGELSALARTPRSATLFADGSAELLEIRWQGLRDLLRKADALREHIDHLYRERSLNVHMLASPLLRHLAERDLNRVAAATELEKFGDFNWQTKFMSGTKAPTQRLDEEPIIAEEGHHPSGLIIIRSGFARVSRRMGNGHRTLTYLGKGQAYGLEELAHNWRSDDQVPLRTTLRASGYVDILRIPTLLVDQFILPSLPADQLPALLTEPADGDPGGAAHPLELEALDPGSEGMLEFLSERRIINGTQTMVIDLDRCTRCDDCVRACAAAHDNSPRFVRHGPVYGNHMVANACMHCADPVCMIGCPTGAIHRDATTGNVIINDLTCIGCATCANSCPYDNIRMVEVRERSRDEAIMIDPGQGKPIVKATKCDLCIDHNGGPACQRACPHDALIRADMRDTEPLRRWLDRS